MSPAARSIFLFAFYPLTVGLAFLLIPGLVLRTLLLPPTDDVYPRAIGVLVVAIAGYYVVAGRNELLPFFQVSIFGRGFLVITFVVLVLLGPGRAALLLVAGLDFAGALWTAYALRRMGQRLVPGLG